MMTADSEAKMSLGTPNATIYVKNLEERIKVDQMKAALAEIFSDYGNIIDIVAKSNLRAKGQAFVVFEKTESAQRALEEVQNFEMYDKPMVLDYARSRSDASVQREDKEEDFHAHKRKRLAEKERKQAAQAVEEAAKFKRTAIAAEPGSIKPSRAVRGAGLKSSGNTPGFIIPEEYLPPNKILFVQNLPETFGVDELTAMYRIFEGFKEARLVPGRAGIAFIEYENESGAISAKESTAGVELGEERRPIKVVYQRQ